jgi:CheY-like chemotaxis protein
MINQTPPVSILVVDDDATKLQTVEAVLANLDVHVVCAQSGRQALRLLLNQTFALTLLDVNMPGMDGFELASLIRGRRNCESMPIIFITAYGDDPFISRGYSLGAVDYILTPIIPDVLRTKVSVFVDLYRRTEQIRRQADHLAQRSAQLSQLANQLTEAEHRERRRLAHILHDDLQQMLVAARMRLSALRPLSANQADAELEIVERLIGDSIATSRSLSIELCPPILHDGDIRKALEWLRGRFQQDHQLLVELVAPDEIPDVPEHLRSFLYQAIRELLFNIVKHAGVAEASVCLRWDGRMLSAIVVDNGRGIEPGTEAGRAGEHFGLFSIRERVQFFNGCFDVHSANGCGTRITLAVPITPAMLVATDPPMPAVSPDPAAGTAPLVHPTAAEGATRILLVDDHVVFRQGLVGLLEATPGIAIIGEASDGLEAIELADLLLPDVVVMDLTMPRMNGIEATRRITANHPHIRVIGLSMHDSQEMEQAIRDAGACRYLTKTGAAGELIQAIREAGEHHRSERPQPPDAATPATSPSEEPRRRDQSRSLPGQRFRAASAACEPQRTTQPSTQPSPPSPYACSN